MEAEDCRAPPCLTLLCGGASANPASWVKSPKTSPTLRPLEATLCILDGMDAQSLGHRKSGAFDPLPLRGNGDGCRQAPRGSAFLSFPLTPSGDWWAPFRREDCRTGGSLAPRSYIKDEEAPGLRCHKHEDKFLIPSKKMSGDGGRWRKMN